MNNSYISLSKNTSKLALKFMGIKNSGHIYITKMFIDDYSQNIEMIIHSTSKYSVCPYCHKRSYQIRSKYVRTLKELPIMSYGCTLRLTVKRFKCKNPKCPHIIFSETFPDLTEKYSRVTNNLHSVLANILIEVSARKGSYITNILKINRSPSSCIRTVLKLNILPQYGVEHIGIDDWANRKGRTYGSIIVNTLTGKPIDLINSREKEDVAIYLKRYTKLLTVTRDRSSSYSAAIKAYHPQAAQIADKFHIIKNLSSVIYEIIRKNHKEIINVYNENKTTPSTTFKGKKNKIEQIDKPYIPVKHESEITKQRQKYFEAVHTLHSKVVSIKTIANTLGISKNTVKKYLRTDCLQGKQIVHKNKYHLYIDDIKECCEKHISISKIYEKIKEKGFNGCSSAFHEWFKQQFPIYYEASKQHFNNIYNSIDLREFRSKNKKQFMSARMLSLFVTSDRYGINTKTGELSEDYITAHEMIEESKILSELRSINKSFRDIMKKGTKQDLFTWLKTCATSKIRQLQNFARTIKNDINPVLNALIYKYTNGLVEGNVNRLKTKKREMYGRANFELLRRKVCLSKLG